MRVSRWKDLFKELLNSSHRPQIIPSPPSVVLRPPYKVCLKHPDIDEIKTAIRSLKSHKSSGKDGLPPELYKAADEIVIAQLAILLLNIYKQAREATMRKEQAAF